MKEKRRRPKEEQHRQIARAVRAVFAAMQTLARSRRLSSGNANPLHAKRMIDREAGETPHLEMLFEPLPALRTTEEQRRLEERVAVSRKCKHEWVRVTVAMLPRNASAERVAMYRRGFEEYQCARCGLFAVPPLPAIGGVSLPKAVPLTHIEVIEHGQHVRHGIRKTRSGELMIHVRDTKVRERATTAWEAFMRFGGGADGVARLLIATLASIEPTFAKADERAVSDALGAAATATGRPGRRRGKKPAGVQDKGNNRPLPSRRPTLSRAAFLLVTVAKACGVWGLANRSASTTVTRGIARNWTVYTRKY